MHIQSTLSEIRISSYPPLVNRTLCMGILSPPTTTVHCNIKIFAARPTHQQHYLKENRLIWATKVRQHVRGTLFQSRRCQEVRKWSKTQIDATCICVLTNTSSQCILIVTVVQAQGHIMLQAKMQTLSCHTLRNMNKTVLNASLTLNKVPLETIKG